MSDLRKAAEQALEALEHAVECVQTNYLPDKCGHDWDKQIEALRQALSQPQEWKTCRHCGFQYRPPKEDKWHPLAQPEQEPVAGMFEEKMPDQNPPPWVRDYKAEEKT